jgi:UDP-N-acetylenolpyruvoylglucosamine reductase
MNWEEGERSWRRFVSPKHANFIVTEGDDAKAADAWALAEEIREKARTRHRFGEVELEEYAASAVSRKAGGELQT